MLQQLKEWFFDPRLVSLISLAVAFYILRDVVRIFLYIFDSSQRSLTSPGDDASPAVDNCPADPREEHPKR